MWHDSGWEAKAMTTLIANRDLTRQAPHSPRDRFGGFAILARTVDKCRASMAGTLGEYHYDCPLDKQLFEFKGISGAKFKTIVSFAKTYEEVALWLQANGIAKTAAEIERWSALAEAFKMKDMAALQGPEHGRELAEHCRKLGLEFEKATLFEWLEADDRASFQIVPRPPVQDRASPSASL